MAALLMLQWGCAHAAAAAPEPSSAPAAVTFHVEGGIAGRIQRLEVEPDGALTLFDRDVEAGTGKLDEASLERLHAIVDSAAFRALLPRYTPRNTCCDRYSYTVRVRRPEGEQSVSTIDGAVWPAPLGEAIQLLNQAKRRVQAPSR
jgi:hypothetical protein